MSDPQELPIPPEVYADPDAMEILRVWVADSKQVVALLGTGWKPRMWGIFLVDLIRHIKNMYELSGEDPAAVEEGIREGMQMEFDNPTDVPETGHALH